LSRISPILVAVTLSSDELQARLAAAGLQRHVEALLRLAAPSVRLRPRPVEGEELPVGSTKLGGRPDLAPVSSWPSRAGAPQSFVAQLNLADAASLGSQRAVLPSAGLLVFFYDTYDTEQQAWGFDPADRGAWQVDFIEPGIPLVRTDFPADLPEHGRYQEVQLAGEHEVTYAPWESFAVDQLGLSRDERFAYAEAFEDQEAVIHRLLGHPDPVQGDMQLECQLASNGIYLRRRKRLPRSTRANALTWCGRLATAAADRLRRRCRHDVGSGVPPSGVGSRAATR
jgi:hypothetical protein